jgi:hypothetical protein
MTVAEALERGLLELVFAEHTGCWPAKCSDQQPNLADNSMYPMGRFYAMECVRCALLAVRQDPERYRVIAGSMLSVTVQADIAKVTALGSIAWSRD